MRMKTIYRKRISIKKVFIVFSIAIIGLIIGYISKSYAIYKLQKDFNILKNQIGTYKSGDYQVAVLVDGKETDTFPSYETNYKVESVDCTNGVTATFDVENWQLNIADMSSTSCKCTVSFNSKVTNSIKPIAQTKKELIALNEEYQNMAVDNVKTIIIDAIYPVGSIYMSTEDDTVDKVQAKFGGTWVKYSEGTTLVGVNDSYTVNSTGGSSSVTLTNANLPSHNHSIPELSVSKWSGTHLHDGLLITGIPTGTTGGSTSGTIGLDYYHNAKGAVIYTTPATVTVSGQKTTASNTNGCTNCSATDVNIQNPYTAVYMYKRTA